METSIGDLKCLVPNSVELPAGPGSSLRGLSFVVKDLFESKGRVASFGHPTWRETHDPASEDSEVVARIREHGGAILGFTKMDQLAYSLIGNVGEGDLPVNTFDPECFCGGSSSGSASAVAGGVASVGVGSDTAGSIRVPSAACGLFGLRPTHGRISSRGVVPLAPSLDVPGAMSRSLESLALTMKVLSAESATVSHHLETILYPSDLSDRVGPEVDAAMEAFAWRLADVTGGTARAVEIEHLVSSDVGDLFARIQGREIWSNHSQWIEKFGDKLAEDVQLRLARCKAWSSDATSLKDEDQAARTGYVEQVEEVLGSSAMLLLPVLPSRGPMLSWTSEQLLSYRLQCFRLTAPSSLCGLPQLAVPILHGDRYVSLGLVGPAGSDDALMDVTLRLAGSAFSISL